MKKISIIIVLLAIGCDVHTIETHEQKRLKEMQ